MAQQIHCDGCGAEPAVVLITSLADGAVQGAGPNCLPTFLRAMLAAVEGGDDEQGDQGDQDDQDEQGEQADPAAPAETGPGTYTETPTETDPSIDPAHPHAPAITGPGTYGEEGGGEPTPAPGVGPDVAPDVLDDDDPRRPAVTGAMEDTAPVDYDLTPAGLAATGS